MNTQPDPARQALANLVAAVSPLNARGTPIRIMDSKLAAAMTEAEAILAPPEPAPVAPSGWLPIENAPEETVIIVTDWERIAFAEKCPRDGGGFYWADGDDSGLEWEPTHFTYQPGKSAPVSPNYILASSDPNALKLDEGDRRYIMEALKPARVSPERPAPLQGRIDRVEGNRVWVAISPSTYNALRAAVEDALKPAPVSPPCPKCGHRETVDKTTQEIATWGGGEAFCPKCNHVFQFSLPKDAPVSPERPASDGEVSAWAMRHGGMVHQSLATLREAFEDARSMPLT